MTLFRRAARAAGAASLTLGLALTLGSAPADATPPSDTHHVAKQPAGEKYQKWGKVFARDQRLRRGCHYYFFSYRLRIPPDARDNWSAEFFITKPNRRALAAPVAISGADPLKGRKRYRVCRPSAYPGRYKIAPKIMYTDTTDHTGYLRPAYFRFLDTRPGGPPA